MKTANQRLVEVRIALGFDNKAEFAKSVGIERSTYDKMEKGPHKPSADNLEKIATKYSEVNLNWLLVGHGPMLFLEGEMPPAQEPDAASSIETKNQGEPEPPTPAGNMKVHRPTYEELVAENASLHQRIGEKDSIIADLKTDKGQLWQQNTLLIELGKTDASSDAAAPADTFGWLTPKPHKQVNGLVRYDNQPATCAHYDLATGQRVIEVSLAKAA